MGVPFGVAGRIPHHGWISRYSDAPGNAACTSRTSCSTLPTSIRACLPDKSAMPATRSSPPIVAELEAVARVFARRMDRTHQTLFHRQQRRLELHALVWIERELLAAERSLEIHEAPRRLERLPLGMHHELAVLHVIEFERMRLH